MGINRAMLRNKHRMLPGLVTVTIYKVSIDDTIRAKQVVPFTRYKGSGVQESASDIGPVRTQTAEITLYRAELGLWQVAENDIIHVVDKASARDEWWRVDSVPNALLALKYICSCTATSAPVGA